MIAQFAASGGHALDQPLSRPHQILVPNQSWPRQLLDLGTGGSTAGSTAKLKAGAFLNWAMNLCV